MLSSSGVVLNTAPPEHLSGVLYIERMYSGTLIEDLLALVDRVSSRNQPAEIRAADSRAIHAAPHSVCRDSSEISEPEQFPQAPGLSAADRNLGLLLVVHAQLVGTLEPRNNFADAVDVHEVGAVRPPEKIRV